MQSNVHVMFIRQLSVEQASFLTHYVDETFGEFANDFMYEPTSYRYLEIGTFGWSTGARMRVKKVSVDRALPYVNKLHAGGWIDDETYHRMYGTVDALLSGQFGYEHARGMWCPESLSENKGFRLGLDESPSAISLDVTGV